MKQITPELIVKLENLYEELDALTIEASDAINLARENTEKPITITRNEKEIELTEGVLWDEIYSRALTNARETLVAIYPDAFAKSELAESKRKELNDFVVSEIGFNPDKMRVSDLLKLVTGYIDYKLDVSRETK